MTLPRVLTIAGSDSSGGAGLQADLKTFSALGVYGMSVVTSVTAQNTVEVRGVQDIRPDVVRMQIDAVAEDLGVDAAKSGMLHTGEIIRVVAEAVKRHRFPIVVDPVMVAKSGARLLEEEAVDALKEELLPVATVVTPNRREAEALSGLEIKGLEDARRAAGRIASLGPKAVVVKGGHMPVGGRVVDLLYEKGAFTLFEGVFIDTTTTHGTGCTFASAIAAELAKGGDIPSAVKAAHQFVHHAIRFGLTLGRGYGPVNQMAVLVKEAEKYRVISELKEAVSLLEADPRFAHLVPECQCNLALALPYAEDVGEVAAIPGRIVRLRDRVRASSCPEFGASRHVARTVLTVMKHDPSLRSALNILYSEEVVEICRRQGLQVSSYDRGREPPEVKAVEGRSISWGVEEAIRGRGGVPDVIYHTGDIGKEAMVTLLGRTARDVVEKAVRIAEGYHTRLQGRAGSPT